MDAICDEALRFGDYAHNHLGNGQQEIDADAYPSATRCSCRTLDWTVSRVFWIICNFIEIHQKVPCAV
jgi:hypothetical protein